MTWNRLLKFIPVFIILLLVYMFFDLLSTRNHLPPDTQILGNQLEDMSYTQAQSYLQTKYQFGQTVTLLDDSHKFYLDLSQLNTKIDFENLFDQIRADYAKRHLLGPLSKLLPPLRVAHNYSLPVIYDPILLSTQLKSIQDQTDADFYPSSLQLQKDQVVYLPGKLGRSLDLQSFYLDLQSNLENYNFSQPISLKYTPLGQMPTDEQVRQAKNNAKLLLGKSLVLTLDDRSQLIPDSELVGLLAFDQTLNNQKISNLVSTLAKTFGHEPVNASFKTDGLKVTEFIPGRDGVTLNAEQTESQIKEGLAQLLATKDTKITQTVSFLSKPPQIRNEDVNNLGIKELLGRGKSTFSHSSAIRNINVSRGAQIVNNILVAPGETFSFNTNLGPVDESHGFKQAYVIKQGRTEMDVGGGICQVSTTLFRAILNSGLNITARQNHAYRVRYYEEDMPPGYDATVFLPSPDLKFINDTNRHLLIQSTYNGQAKSLVYEIWGTKDGRQVEISNYKQWGAAPPPPTRYEDDPTLPVGKLVQVETAIPGLKTSFDWKVERNGETLQQRTFTSNYVPWAAVYKRGVAQTN